MTLQCLQTLILTLDCTQLAIQCNCGSQYSHAAGNAVEKFSSTLYTGTSSVHMKCYNMHCDKGICEIEYSEAAKEKCLFYLTTETYAEDEIG